MKHLNLLFLLLFLGNITTWAQNKSQELVNLIQTKKWFEIENFYQQNKDSIDNEIVKPYYLAMTGEVFNRPYEAINAYEHLIDTNPLNRYEYKCPQIDIKINDQVITMINDCSVSKDRENDNQYGATEGGFLGNAIFKYCKKAIFDFNNMVFSMEK